MVIEYPEPEREHCSNRDFWSKRQPAARRSAGEVRRSGRAFGDVAGGAARVWRRAGLAAILFSHAIRAAAAKKQNEIDVAFGGRAMLSCLTKLTRVTNAAFKRRESLMRGDPGGEVGPFRGTES
jgi:hypothetical protein